MQTPTLNINNINININIRVTKEDTWSQFWLPTYTYPYAGT